MTIAWRESPEHADIAAVRALVRETGFFTAAEIAIAAELVQERLAKGEASGYEFLFACDERGLAGYACYGETPGAEGTFDLYWIVVAPARQGQGLGQTLISRVCATLRARRARLLYADTSSTEKYAPTRRFYLAAGFREAARLEDFYRPGDGKVIYELKI